MSAPNFGQVGIIIYGKEEQALLVYIVGVDSGSDVFNVPLIGEQVRNIGRDEIQVFALWKARRFDVTHRKTQQCIVYPVGCLCQFRINVVYVALVLVTEQVLRGHCLELALFFSIQFSGLSSSQLNVTCGKVTEKKTLMPESPNNLDSTGFP